MNGTESTTSEYLKNSSGNNVTRTEAEKNKYNVNMHNMSWTEIANEADKTKFLDCMLCGDTKAVELNLSGPIAKDTSYNQLGDGSGMIYDTINGYYMIWNPSSEQNAAAINGGTYGSNARDEGGYSSSHIRATLIGENNKTNIEYAGNVNLNADTCLYNNIDSELKNLITAKKIRYVTGTSHTTGFYDVNDDIADKIWLFSETELCGTGEYSGYSEEGFSVGVSGSCYDKYGNLESKYCMMAHSNTENSLEKVGMNLETVMIRGYVHQILAMIMQ